MNDKSDQNESMERRELYVLGAVPAYIAHPDDDNGRNLDCALRTLQAFQRQQALEWRQQRSPACVGRDRPNGTDAGARLTSNTT